MTTQIEETCEWLCDFCGRCAVTRGRWDSITEPDEIRCRVEGSAMRMEAEYRCRCGHRWTTNFTDPFTQP